MVAFFPRQRPVFSAALRDVHAKSPEARRLAAESLGQPPESHVAEAIDALIILIDDRDGQVRATALRSVGALGANKALPSVLTRFQDGNRLVRQFALIAAGQIGDPSAASSLRDALQSTAPEVRFQAISSLSELLGHACIADLSALCGDEDAEVRRTLAECLGTFESKEAEHSLRTLLHDKDTTVRFHSAMGLARLGDSEGAEELLKGLHHPAFVFDAAWAIGELKITEANKALRKIANAVFKPSTHKAAAAAALVRLGDNEGVEILRTLLTGFRSDARSYAVQLVGEVGAVALIPELTQRMLRPRGVEREVTAEALAQLVSVSASARETLETLARRSDAAGASARSTLARLSDKND